MSAAGPDRDRRYAMGVALVLLAGVFWSLAGILLRNIEAATSWQIIFYRSLFLALTLLAVIAVRHRGRVVGAFRAIGRVGVIGGACVAVGYIAIVLSILNTTVANALFIFASTPFFAAALGWLILREPVRRRTWGTIAVALCGVGVMVAEGLAGGGLFGNLMAVVMTLAFAALIVALRHGRAVDMMPTVCLGGALAAVAGLILADGLAISLHDLMICLLLGSVQVGAGMVAFTIGSRHVPAAELGLLSMTEAVFGPVWVWLGVAEVPTLLTFAGGALVLGALVTQAVSGIRAGPPRP